MNPRKPDARTDALARNGVGDAIEVHRFGAGYVEHGYEEAIHRVLIDRPCV